MADARVSSSHRPLAAVEDERPHVVEREEIVDVTTEEFGGVAAHQTPSRERADDEIDVTTISNSPNGTAIAPARAPSKSTPSAMNLDNFIREDARLSALRKMQQSRATASGDADYRQATDHDYASSTNRTGGGRFGSSALFRQSVLPSAALAAAGSSRAETATAAPAAAAPISPSAIHRRKRKGASTDHPANSDSDDPDEKMFRNAKIEYTKAYNPEDTNDFSCPRCPAQFESRVGLTNHLKLHGSAKQFPCSMCDFCCTNKKTMRQHRRIHGVVRRPGKQAAAVVTPAESKNEIEVDEPDDEEFVEQSPEKQEVSVTSVTTRSAKYASSSAGVRKPPVGAASALRPVTTTRQSLTRPAIVQPQMRTRRSGETIQPLAEAAAALSKNADSIDKPPTLRAVGVDVMDEQQTEKAATNQPIIRAIDFALKLNLDEHGNPLPLPARDAANQSFTLGGGRPASPASITSLPSATTVTEAEPAAKSPAKVKPHDEEEMPLLPQEMQHEETSDDDEPEDGQPAGASNKNRVKCKDCPFTARTVAHLQPHLLGHSRETGYKCQFCTFKTESLGFMKRHINIHNEAQFTWPPEYIGDSQEHIQKLLAKERKRLALERRRKAEAQHNGAESSSSSKPVASQNDTAEGEEAKDDVSAEGEIVAPTPRRRGAKAAKLEPEEPTRRSTRTSRPPKPVYTAGETHSARRVQAADEPDDDDSLAPVVDVTPKRTVRKSTSDASIVSGSGQKPAAIDSPSTSSAGGSKTPAAEFNQCKLCDYKVAARAPAAVMIRHVMRRHKAEDDDKKT